MWSTERSRLLFDELIRIIAQLLSNTKNTVLFNNNTVLFPSYIVDIIQTFTHALGNGKDYQLSLIHFHPKGCCFCWTSWKQNWFSTVWWRGWSRICMLWGVKSRRNHPLVVWVMDFEGTQVQNDYSIWCVTSNPLINYNIYPEYQHMYGAVYVVEIETIFSYKTCWIAIPNYIRTLFFRFIKSFIGHVILKSCKGCFKKRVNKIFERLVHKCFNCRLLCSRKL